MKMFFKIVKYRFIASLKHPVILICFSAAVACSMLVGIYAQKEQHSGIKYPIAVVDEDGGEYAKMFIQKLNLNQLIDMKIMSREKALKQVASGKVDGAFVLIEGFSEKINDNDFNEIIEFMTPTVTTSAYPVSEIVSAEVIDIWLAKLVKNRTYELYNEFGDRALISYDEILTRIETMYIEDDIISIELVGNENIEEAPNEMPPADKAVGVFAAFAIFAIMLSGEWIFNLQKRSLQNRFISANTSLAAACLGSQAAVVLVSMLFFLPLATFIYLYLNLELQLVLYLLMGMFLFSSAICLMAFTISTLVENLTQLVVLGASISIMNILISSLALPAPNWEANQSIFSKMLPGTYLAGCYEITSKLYVMSFLAIVWLAISYLAVLRIRKTVKI